MKALWEQIKLDDLFVLQMGKTPAREREEFWRNGNNKWVSIADIGRFSRYTGDTKEKITDQAVSESGIRQVPPNTLIMSFKLSIGKVAITREPLYTNEAIMAFIDRGERPLYLPFLFHLFRSKDWSAGTNKAVLGMTLNKATLKEISIPVPALSEQENISGKLDKICYLISLREQQLQKLNQLASSRFIEMFGNGMYPSCPLIDLIESGAGLSYGIVQPGDDGTGDMGVLRPVDLVGGGISTDSIKYVNRDIGNGFKRTELTGKEILISVRGTTGITAVTDYRFAGMNVTRGIAVIRFDKDKVNPLFLNAAINDPKSQSFIQEHTRGATLKQINLADLRLLPIVYPPMELQNEFASFIAELDKSKVTIQKSLDKLNLLYKALLQEYFG